MAPTHDPNAVLDYAVDWTSWLKDGDTITAVSWTVPDGITQASPAPSHDGKVCVIWLSGGTARQEYRLVCHVTTVAGRQDDRTLRIYVDER